MDRDGDRWLDHDDRCPVTPGQAPDGCPEPDRDDDGFLETRDACPELPGSAPDGCPETDRDGDGLLDLVDRCPDDPGVAPDGCPVPDTDGDGLFDDADRCATVPETKNGFEDGDGCGDEVPERLVRGLAPYQYKLSEVTGKEADFPGPGMRRALHRVAEALREFPTVRIEVSMHSDSKEPWRYFWRNRGSYMGWATRQYLVEVEGIAAERVQTRYAGMDEPVDSNRTAAGRAKNRRLEFVLLVE